jgi:hypothetical protein
MYGDFAGAHIDGRHLITGPGSAELLATSIHEQVLAGSFAWTVGEDPSQAGDVPRHLGG